MSIYIHEIPYNMHYLMEEVKARAAKIGLDFDGTDEVPQIYLALFLCMLKRIEELENRDENPKQKDS